MGIRTRIRVRIKMKIRIGMGRRIRMTFSRLRVVVITLSWYEAEQSPGATRTWLLLRVILGRDQS